MVDATSHAANSASRGFIGPNISQMHRFRVKGGATLRGEVRVSGAKNSVLKLMAATLLAVGESTLTDVPRILDVGYMADLLRRMGCEVTVAEDFVRINVPPEIGHDAPYELVRRLRASICVLGPLVARCGRAVVALPGGDNIGSRGLDMHVAGLQRMGATVDIEHGFVVSHGPCAEALSHVAIQVDTHDGHTSTGCTASRLVPTSSAFPARRPTPRSPPTPI